MRSLPNTLWIRTDWCFIQFGLYVLGFSHRAQALRLFAVERIVAIDVSHESFEITTDLNLDTNYERLFCLIDERSEPFVSGSLRMSPTLSGSALAPESAE